MAAAALPPNIALEAATSLHVWQQNLKTDPDSAAGLHAPGIAKVSLWREHTICVAGAHCGFGESQSHSFQKSPSCLHAYL